MHRRLGFAAAAALSLLVALRDTATAFELTPAPDDDPNEAGQMLTVEHETVTLGFVSALSGWDDELTWEGLAAGSGLRCHDATPGASMELGRFDARSELLLFLTTAEGDVWSSGPGERNADGAAHARLTVVAPDTVLVEWEDLPAGGDRDYNDCVVTLTISQSAP